MRCSRFAGFAAVAAACVMLPVVASAQERPECKGEVGHVGASAVPSAHVDVTSDAKHAALARVEFLGPGLGRGGFYDVTRICNLPCTTTLPEDGASYRVIGPGLTPSPAFEIPDGATGVDVRVRTGSWRPYAAGLALSVLGMAYTPTGVAFLGARAAISDRPNAGVIAGVGGAFLGVGIVALAVGLPLWLGNRTQLTVDPHSGARSAVGSNNLVQLTPAGLAF